MRRTGSRLSLVCTGSRRFSTSRGPGAAQDQWRPGTTGRDRDTDGYRDCYSLQGARWPIPDSGLSNRRGRWRNRANDRCRVKADQPDSLPGGIPQERCLTARFVFSPDSRVSLCFPVAYGIGGKVEELNMSGLRR
jgi:hypothetical protein